LPRWLLARPLKRSFKSSPLAKSAKMAGMELTDGVHWRELYGRGGTVTSDSMGRKRTGKWRVEKDQLCIEFDKDPPAKCYEVWMSGRTVELRRESLMPLQGVIEQPLGRK
jgi:hypothetical protein